MRGGHNSARWARWSFALSLAAAAVVGRPARASPPVGAQPARPVTPIKRLTPPTAAQPIADPDVLAEGDLAEGAQPDPMERTRILLIHRIEVRGAEQVSPRQIRGVLADEDLVRGEEIVWPSSDRVERARARLRATGYFKRVTLRVEPRPDAPDQVVLIVDVEERSTLTLQRVYLGSAAATPFRGGLRAAERNFLGRGILLGGAFVWGTRPRIERGRRQQAYELFVESPRLGETRIAARGAARFVSAGEPYRVSGALDDPAPTHFRTVDYERLGGSVGVLFHIAPGLVIDTGYRFERVDARLPVDPSRVDEDGTLVPIDLGLRDGRHRLTAADFALTWDGRDQAFLAGKGGRVAVDVQVSSPAVGSQYEYVKLVAAGAYTFRLPWRHWLTPSASGGQIAGDAPRFEQFYAGDFSSWTPGREVGLRYSTRNPVDVFGTGIDRRTFGSIFGRFDLEYAIPLFRRTRTRLFQGGDLFFSLGVFSLVGDAAERREHRDRNERVAPAGARGNLGLRLDTSLGTFDISVGSVLRRTPL